jgi:hypothetical protein
MTPTYLDLDVLMFHELGALLFDRPCFCLQDVTAAVCLLPDDVPVEGWWAVRMRAADIDVLMDIGGSDPEDELRLALLQDYLEAQVRSGAEAVPTLIDV